jgi:TolB protein
MRRTHKHSFWSGLGWTGILLLCSACQPAAAPAVTAAPSLAPTLTPSPIPEIHCSQVEQLPNDSVAAQQILEEFVLNFKEQQPTEYMGLAVLHRVDRLGEWAVVQGSISGDDRSIIAVHQTPQGYQLAEHYIITAPVEPDEMEEFVKQVTQYFIERLPEAPEALFTCLERIWLPGLQPRPTEPPATYQLIYIGTDNGNTTGTTEIYAILFDGSDPRVVLSAKMMIMGLVLSRDGSQLAFWGCPGSIAYDCIPPEEDLDVWSLDWDGSNLRNLTEDSTANDLHPGWSADGKQIVFESDRSGESQLYIMNADGSNVKALTKDALRNTEPTWSPDGKWIAYHCREGFDTRICVISPEGQPAGGMISGVSPVWSPPTLDGGMRLAFLCSDGSHSDICVVGPDGSDLVNLTNTPSDEHSPAWSPDGKWLAFVSNRHEDIDIYKICVTCPGEPFTVRLTDEPRAAGWPAWSPDGSWLAYADVPGQTLMLVKSDRSRVRFLAGDIFQPPVWRP